MNTTDTASGSALTTSWRTCVTLAAGGWGAFYALLGIYWWVGGPGYPFGRNDLTGPENGSLLSGVDVHTGAPAILLVGLAGVLTAWVMDQRLGRGRHRWSVIAAGSTIVAVLLVVAIDSRSITLLPPLGLLGWALIRDWPTFNQLLLALGAVLWIAATTTYVGMTNSTPRSLARQARTTARWVTVGKVATVVAVACPLPYAVIRWSWALGRPIGAPRSFVDMLERNQPGVAVMEAVLATFAVAGATLTAGLLLRWGRTFPRWLPFVGGRPVPLWFPLSFGTSAALAIFPFGRVAWQDQLGIDVAGTQSELQLWGLDPDRPAFWGVGGLGWLFPIWSIALALALAGYAHRYPRSNESTATDVDRRHPR